MEGWADQAGESKVMNKIICNAHTVQFRWNGATCLYIDGCPSECQHGTMRRTMKTVNNFTNINSDISWSQRSIWTGESHSWLFSPFNLTITVQCWLKRDILFGDIPVTVEDIFLGGVIWLFDCYSIQWPHDSVLISNDDLLQFTKTDRFQVKCIRLVKYKKCDTMINGMFTRVCATPPLP